MHDEHGHIGELGNRATRPSRVPGGRLRRGPAPATACHARSTCSPLGRRRADREPQRRAPVEHGAREQHLRPSRWPLDQRVRRARRRRRRRKHSRLSGCGATISKRSSAATSAASCCVSSTWRRIIARIAATPSSAERHPQLERPEAAPERDLPVAVVDRRAGLGRRRAEVLGQDAQRAEQRGPVGGPVQVAVEVDAHPLVRVGAVAVGELEAVVDPAVLGRRARRCRSSPRRRAATARLGGRSSAIAGVGSNASDDVVPWVEQTKNGTSPAARSAATIAASASGPHRERLGRGRRCAPVGADAGDAQPLLDARVRLRRGVGDERVVSPSGLTAPARRPPARRQDRHQRRLAGRALDHAAAGRRSSSGTRSGRPSSSAIQSSISVSSSVHAGDVTQLMPCTPRPAASSSPRIDGYDVLRREVGEEARVLPVDDARARRRRRGRRARPRTARARSAGARAAGPGRRRARRRRDRAALDALDVVGDPVDQLVAAGRGTRQASTGLASCARVDGPAAAPRDADDPPADERDARHDGHEDQRLAPAAAGLAAAARLGGTALMHSERSRSSGRNSSRSWAAATGPPRRRPPTVARRARWRLADVATRPPRRAAAAGVTARASGSAPARPAAPHRPHGTRSSTAPVGHRDIEQVSTSAAYDRGLDRDAATPSLVPSTRARRARRRLRRPVRPAHRPPGARAARLLRDRARTASRPPRSPPAQPAALILSGGPKSVHVEGAPSLDPAIYDLGIPILGICYGAQLIAQQLGGTVGRGMRGEYGRAKLRRDRARRCCCPTTRPTCTTCG